LVAPALTHAQHNGGMVSMPAPAVRVNAALPSVRVHTTSGAQTVASHQRAASTSFSWGAAFDLLPNFNFEHLSTIDHDTAIKVLIDPVTKARLRIVQQQVKKNGFVAGFYLLDGGGYYAVPVNAENQPQAEQPVEMAQQPAQQAPAEATAALEMQAPEEPPLPDEGEFTLVTREGSQIEAVAFTRMDDKIVYITPAGGRRTIAATDLDPDATNHLNQERGTPLQIPPLTSPINPST
jgi:hypothetical protein